MPAVLDRPSVLDFPVDAIDLALAVARVADAVALGAAAGLQIVTLNAEMAMQGRENAALGAVIRASGLVVPDGSGVVWALRRRGVRVAKVAGVDLVRAIAARGAAAPAPWRVYFLGAKPGIAEGAARAIASEHPGLVVAGCHDGYFGAADEPRLLDEIRAARPDILFVALGVPRQETWIASHQAALGVPVAMGVGGSFDVFAGNVRRAPRAFRRLHLEWLFRLMQEPWRFQRMQSTLPGFVREVLRHG